MGPNLVKSPNLRATPSKHKPQTTAMEAKDHCSSSSSSSHPGPTPKRKTGRKKFKETRHPVYHGVRERNGGKWVCEVRKPHNKSRLWLGTFATPAMAARAHDVAAIALRGGTAPLNFPVMSWALPRPRSLSPLDIRSAAAEAAVMFQTEKREELELEPKPKVVFVDEEEMFNVPELMDEMAAGMLVTPLAMQRGFDWNGVECAMDLSLWSL